MSTIENNELFAILRDLDNHSITVPDAMGKIQDLTKKEMKEVVTEDLPPDELAAEVSEAQQEQIQALTAEEVASTGKKSRK